MFLSISNRIVRSWESYCTMFWPLIFRKSVHDETSSLDTQDEDCAVVAVPLTSVACDDDNSFVDACNDNAETF